MLLTTGNGRRQGATDPGVSGGLETVVDKPD
jgi:hypothetical protein